MDNLFLILAMSYWPFGMVAECFSQRGCELCTAGPGRLVNFQMSGVYSQLCSMQEPARVLFSPGQREPLVSSQGRDGAAGGWVRQELGQQEGFLPVT